MVREEIRYLNRSYNKEANKPIRKSPIRQDISTIKRGERGDKISQQKFQRRKGSTTTLDDERYHIPNVKDLGTSKRQKLQRRSKKRKRDGNQTRIGCSYTTEVPITLRSHREVGNLSTKQKANEMPYQHEGRAKPMQEADHETTRDKTMTTSNAR